MDLSSNGTLTTAPPPPPEVKVRTMKSDLASMAKSGGGLPQFQNVKVSGLSVEQESATVVVQAKSKSNFFLTIVVVVVAIALLVVGWFVYAKLVVGKFSSVIPPARPAVTPPSPTQAKSQQVVVPTATPVTSNQPPILNLGPVSTSTASSSTLPY